MWQKGNSDPIQETGDSWEYFNMTQLTDVVYENFSSPEDKLLDKLGIDDWLERATISATGRVLIRIVYTAIKMAK